MDSFACTPISTFAADRIAELFAEILADSENPPPPPKTFNGEAFERRFSFEHLDRQASRFLSVNGQVVAFILIARRGSSTHISGLGVLSKYRRTGLGRHLVESACREARGRGDSTVTVEVSEQNVPARLLYESAGFSVKRGLVGFTRYKAAHEEPWCIPEPLDTDAVARSVTSAGYPLGMPWFLQEASLFGCSRPTRGFHVNHQAYAIATAWTNELHVRLLFVRAEHRRRGLGRRLLNGVGRTMDRPSFYISPFVPAGLCDDFFRSLNFEVTSPQLELQLRFPPS